MDEKNEDKVNIKRYNVDIKRYNVDIKRYNVDFKKDKENSVENEVIKDNLKEDKIDINYLLQPIDTDIIFHPSITSFKSIKNYKKKEINIFSKDNIN